MKLFVAIEVVDGNEGNPGIHIHHTKAGRDATVARLRLENEELQIDEASVIIVEDEIEVLP